MQAGIAAALAEQFVVGSDFNDPSLFQRHDPVTLADRGKPVRDDEDSSSPRHGAQVALDGRSTSYMCSTAMRIVPGLALPATAQPAPTERPWFWPAIPGWCFDAL